MITFTNMNYVAMFDMIKKGRVSRRNEDWHETTMVKQIVYNFIIFTVYLRLGDERLTSFFAFIFNFLFLV